MSTPRTQTGIVDEGDFRGLRYLPTVPDATPNVPGRTLLGAPSGAATFERVEQLAVAVLALTALIGGTNPPIAGAIDGGGPSTDYFGSVSLDGGLPSTSYVGANLDGGTP